MSEEVGIGGAGERSKRRSRMVLLAFGAMGLVAIFGAVALPGMMVERAVTSCERGGGFYDRGSATCIRG